MAEEYCFAWYRTLRGYGPTMFVKGTDIDTTTNKPKDKYYGKWDLKPGEEKLSLADLAARYPRTQEDKDA